MAPQRLKVLQQQLARHGGLQKGGSTDIVFDQQKKLQDPRDTAIERQMKAMPAAQKSELASAWRVDYRQLRIHGWWWQGQWLRCKLI